MSHAADVQRYIDDVLNGSIITGRLERLAVHRHCDDLKHAEARGYVFEEKYATAALNFAGLCNQFEGDYAGLPLELRLEQKFLVWCLFGWRSIKTGLRRFRHVQCEVGRKWGKALALDTMIPTPTGWTTMGEIRAGDTVFDEHGNQCRVTACTEVMWNRPCYRVVFSDRTSIVADEEHEWLTTTKHSGVSKKGRKRVPCGDSYRVLAIDENGDELTGTAIRTTRQIKDSLLVSRGRKYDERNHRVAVCGPIATDHVDLPVHPYLLGVWLGDGHSASSRFTCSFADSQILDEIASCGVTVKKCESGATATTGLYVLGSPGRVGSQTESLARTLRLMGLKNNKHIPREYLRSSPAQRWDLLHGLMDTDGCVDRTKSNCEYTTTSLKLANGVVELARSLGLKPTLGVGRATLYGKDCGPKYRIVFSPPVGTVVFRLKRKQSRLESNSCKPSNSSRAIVAVEPVQSVPVRCIEVDSPSHLYLAGEGMIPTHNSTVVAYLGCLLLYADWPIERGAQGYVAATKLDQAAIVWECAKNMISQSPALKKRADVTDYNHRIFLRDLRSVFKPLAADKTPDGFNPHFIIKDEEHAWRENHRGQSNTLRSGFGARSQPLTITITTYGSDDSVLWIENHDYAVSVLESVVTGEIVNDSWLVFICALDYPNSVACFRCLGKDCPWCGGTGTIAPDDPYDETIWRKANPGIGDGEGCTPKTERMREDATLARGLPSYELEFFQKNLNIRVASQYRMITPEAWAACRGEFMDWNRASRVHGAADPGVSNDMFGGAVVARFDMTDDDGTAFKRFEIRSRAWTCADRHEAVSTPQIARWIQEDKLGECPGNQVRFSDAIEWAYVQTKLYGVCTWAYDKSWARVFGQELQERYSLTVFPFTQSHYHYNNVVGVLEGLLNEVHTVNGEQVRALCHDGDPVLAWMMSNMVIHRNTKGERMPDKSDPTRKIDIAVAVLMAISECLYSAEGNIQEPQLIVL